MAEASAIAAARANLGENSAEQSGWSDEEIGARLDLNETPATIALAYWRTRIASTAMLVSVSESGSTRDLGSLYKNAQALVEYWSKEVERERQVADGETPKRTRIRFHRTTRI